MSNQLCITVMVISFDKGLIAASISAIKELLQHSSIAVTQRYIGVSSDEIEEALAKHIELI